MAGWALLGAAACGTTFAISTIPAPVPDGRSIPLVVWAAQGLLALAMVPGCAVLPAPLLIAGRNYLRHSAHARQRWVTAWTVAGALSVAVESLFLWRLLDLLFGFSHSYWNLPEPSWHAFAFFVAFLIAGAAMACVLICARRSVSPAPMR